MESTLLVTVISSVITCAATALFTWMSTRDSRNREVRRLEQEFEQKAAEAQKLQRALESVQSEVAAAEAKIASLEAKAEDYDMARDILARSGVVKTYYQPVVLLGPRGVGKTSLIMQWHAPWVMAKIRPTATMRSSEVPVYDHVKPDREPHFAVPDLLTKVTDHLMLRVYDFPGELNMQKAIKNLIVNETDTLRDSSTKNLGIVIICMFDAEEASTGLSKDTTEYYNGELFRELMTLVAHSKVSIERLILVFNKYDNLMKHHPRASQLQLLELCLEKFSSVYTLLRRSCNQERVCEVFTILDRDEMHFNNKGALIVKGEASRAFVEAYAGKHVADEVVTERASNLASERFL